MTQDWRVGIGFAEVTVRGEGWLDALAAALPHLGFEYGSLGRLKVETEPDGTTIARDPVTDVEIRIEPVGGDAGFAPSPSFDAVDAGETLAAEEDPTALPRGGLVAPLPPDENTESGGKLVATPPAATVPRDGLPDDVMEDLFLRLGEIATATGVAAASGIALRILLDLVPAGAGAVLIRTRSGDGLRFRAASGPAAGKLVDTVIPLERGIAGFVCQLGVGLSVADARRDRRHDDKVARSTGYTTRAMLAVPVRADTGASYGCVELLNPPAPFSDRDLAIATRVAASLGAFLQSVYAGR